MNTGRSLSGTPHRQTEGYSENSLSSGSVQDLTEPPQVKSRRIHNGSDHKESAFTAPGCAPLPWVQRGFAQRPDRRSRLRLSDDVARDEPVRSSAYSPPGWQAGVPGQ